MPRHTWAILIVVFGGLWLPEKAIGQSCEIHASTRIYPADHGWFGRSLAADGNVLIVGGDESVYIWRWNGSVWVQEQKIVPTDLTPGSNFGSAVAISGNVAVVGAPEDFSYAPVHGSAYIYRYNGSEWVKEMKVHGSGIDVINHFGNAVAVEGDVAVIGAHRHAAAGGLSGGAYSFQRVGATWVEAQLIVPDDAADGDEFGISL